MNLHGSHLDDFAIAQVAQVSPPIMRAPTNLLPHLQALPGETRDRGEAQRPLVTTVGMGSRDWFWPALAAFTSNRSIKRFGRLTTFFTRRLSSQRGRGMFAFGSATRPRDASLEYLLRAVVR
jgi:hypothetical protein